MEEDEEAKRKEEEKAKRKEEEEVEKKRMEKEIEQKAAEDAERKRKDEDEKKKEMEEQEARDTSEKQRQDEAAAHAQKEVEGTETEQAELDEQNADRPGDQATEEKEDDSKTLHSIDISGTQHQQRPSETDNVQDSTSRHNGDFTEGGSEITEISAITTDPPQEASVRLERMMILRAQMVEVEKRLDELRGKGLDETSPEMKAAEKTLRKYQRQTVRRYDAGMLFFKSCG